MEGGYVISASDYVSGMRPRRISLRLPIIKPYHAIVKIRRASRLIQDERRAAANSDTRTRTRTRNARTCVGTKVARARALSDCEISFSGPAICEIDGGREGEEEEEEEEEEEARQFVYR